MPNYDVTLRSGEHESVLDRVAQLEDGVLSFYRPDAMYGDVEFAYADGVWHSITKVED